MPVALAADGVVELAIISIAISLILLRRVWVSTFGHLLLALASPFDHANVSFSVLGRRIGIGFGWVASLLRGVNSSALHLLGAGIEATDYAAKKLWHWTAYLVVETGRVIGDMAESYERELSWLWRHSIPYYIGARLHPLASKVEWLIHRIGQLEAHPTTIVRPVTRILDPRIGALERDVTRLERKVAGLPAAVASPPVALPLPGLGSIHTGIDALRDRLGRLSRLLTPAAVAGLVASALIALRAEWLKCSNVERAAKHLCGMDADVLEALLADTVAIFGTVSLVTMATEMQALISDIEAPVRVFWRA